MHTSQYYSSHESRTPSSWSSPNGRSDTDARTILVVDDEPQIVDLLASLLEDEGYCVRCAYDGQQALGAISDDSPELVISDVMMPEVSGIDLMNHLQRSNEALAPKMILMSAVGKPISARGVPFLQKPFDVEVVLEMIDDALEDDDRLSH